MSSQIEFLQQAEVQDFIQRNLGTDAHKLLLNPPAAYKAHIALIVDQLISRKKARSKLSDWYGNPQLVMPPPLSLEQCSSPATANYKASLMQGTNLIDLTGGMGIDTLHLAEAFEQTTYVERDEWLCEVFQHNSQLLTSKEISTAHTTAENFLDELSEKASFFIDPARRDLQKKQVFHFENCTPNLLELLPLFEQKAEQVLVKAAPMIDITLGIEQLRFVHSVHVVSVKNEVKEVLFLLDFKNTHSAPQIHCVNLGSQHPIFSFTQSAERNTDIEYAPIHKYLYDPNASILKAGAFKAIAAQYSLHKLAPNTHLYTSDEQLVSFPGRIFEVTASNITKKNIRQLLPDSKANVLTKNYPQKPEELKKKLKIKDGGSSFIIGYSDQENKPKLVLTNRVNVS
ncbi:THUMP-like domain-containing protein [Marinoscillum furvescens]|uniref:Uncharacterized protein n=1 Tax=Marinoscillum furvescens DSM 4134 TaxID=1122208 RepID=A0A3D9L4I1_MARFU|nr:SAM-dependent methyltransferase [Marinoscillum furvescens]REE00513.1 hypothetical protein C7460_105136 [Marinoscillum furvescens DSM 4134]